MENYFDDEEFQALFDDYEPLIDQAVLPLDDCLNVISTFGKGVSRQHAKMVEELGLLDEDYPVEAFTVAPSSLNEDVLMLGLIGGILKALGAIAKAIGRIIAMLIRAVTFPFRWALGMTGDSSSGGGGGGGGGGGSVSSSKYASTAERLKRKEKEIEKRLKELPVDPEKSDFNLEKYLLGLAQSGTDPTGIGSMLNHVATVAKANSSIPPGIFDALNNQNDVLASLGISSGTYRGGSMKSKNTSVWVARQRLLALTLMQNNLANVVSARLFWGEEKAKFTKYEGEGGARRMAGFIGNNIDAAELFLTCVGRPNDDPRTAPLVVGEELLKDSRFRTFAAFLSGPLSQAVPILKKASDIIRDTPMDYAGSNAQLVANLFEQFKDDPFWEEVMEEVGRLNKPDPEYIASKAGSGNIPVLTMLSNPDKRETLSNCWAVLESHVYNRVDTDGLGQVSKDTQLSELDAMFSSPTVYATPQIVGLNFSRLALRARKEYGLDDKRAGDVFNKLMPGGMLELPADTAQSAYTLETLQGLVGDLTKKGYTREAEAFKSLIAVIKDDIAVQTHIVKFAALIQSNFTLLLAAAWFGLQEWMLDVQDAYASIIACSLLHHVNLGRIFTDVEMIIGRKMTDEEKILIAEDVGHASNGDVQMPAAALAVIYGAEGTDPETYLAQAEKVTKFAIDYTKAVKEGHLKRMRMIGGYMHLNRHSENFKTPETTINDLLKIIDQKPIVDLIDSRKRSRLDKFSYASYSPKYVKPVKISDDLRNWLRGRGGNKFPTHENPEILEHMRANHGRMLRINYLKYNIQLRQTELNNGMWDEDFDKNSVVMLLEGMKEELRDLQKKVGKRTNIRHAP